VALPIEFKTMVGSQQVPYIYEEYTSVETVAAGFLKLYNMGPDGRSELGQKARDYALSEFAINDTIDMWHNSLVKLIEEWPERQRREAWSIREI